MRECIVTLNSDNTVDISTVCQYIGEHAATQLSIVLSDELCAEDVSYYTLCFNAGGAANPYRVKLCSDAITASSAYGRAEDGVIYFALPKALTGFSTLEIQVEAHTADENGSIIKTVKSPVFEIAFSKSVDGDEAIIPEKSFEIIEEMRKALLFVNGFSEEIAEIHTSIEGINGAVDGIEALIDESGVLE